MVGAIEGIHAVPDLLNSKAERLLTIAQTLNNPADRVIASKFVEDLKALAAQEVTPPAISCGAGLHQVSKAALGAALKKAFPLSNEGSFDRLICAL